MSGDQQKAFSIPVRVYIEDTDAGGIVFYANYLKFFERARTELIREKGYQLRSGLADNVSYVVHSIEVKYHRSACLDDLISVFAEIEKVGRTYLDFKQWATDEAGNALVSGKVRVACIDWQTGKPRALPDGLRRALD